VPILISAYLNSDFGAAAVFAEDVGSNTLEHFAECSAAEEHGQLDLVSTDVFQWRDIFQS